MEKRGLSLAEIQEVPKNSLILLAGPPGAGKSTFCHRVVLNGLAMDKPVIFVTTEQRPTQIISLLREKGLGEPTPKAMTFVDAYSQTVGVESPERPDTIHANCMDLNSISIATTKLQERMGRSGILLAFDSLTSPYLLSGAEVTRFMRLFLSKFAAEGNSALALMDEGCGKSQDLTAMMSIADGVVRVEMGEDKQLLNVVKHPKVRPIRTEVPLEREQVEPKPAMMAIYSSPNYASAAKKFFESFAKGEAVLRSETGDFVNLFWPTLEHWSGMIWDPKRFPTMIYDMNREEGALAPKVVLELAPTRMKLMMKLMFLFQSFGLLLPKSFSKVKDMERLLKSSFSQFLFPCHMEHSGIIEYMKDISETDEHYLRLYESADCWGFENVGTTIASHLPPEISGMLSFYDKEKRDWNAIETKCIGLGNPYCEFKFVPGEIDELKGSLEKDSVVVERIHERLMDRLMGFLLEGKPLVERPKLGADVHLHVAFHAMGFPHVAGERYRMAQRMGGARTGKEVGERLIKAGITEDDAAKRILNLMDHCKVGKVSMGETIRIKENVESTLESFVFATERKEPCCYFTTGFLNGFFSALKNQHVKEIKCIGAGDPYCEWEIK